MSANAGIQSATRLVARVTGFGPLSRLRERVGVRAGRGCEGWKVAPHPALRAIFSRKREKGF